METAVVDRRNMLRQWLHRPPLSGIGRPWAVNCLGLSHDMGGSSGLFRAW